MFSLPPQVSRALALLNSAGHEAYLVGGAVRDYAMGKTPHDWDITTAALPEQTAAVFAHYRLIETGIRLPSSTKINSNSAPWLSFIWAATRLASA